MDDLRACVSFPLESSPFPVPTDLATDETYVAGYEGWWNSSPANPDGSLKDPSEWTDAERERPRVALIDPKTGIVIGSYDRTTCQRVENIPTVDLTPYQEKSVVIIDTETAEVIESW